MTYAKHFLTHQKDTLTGNSGADLFIAPLKNGKPTLASVDLINGKAGYDVLQGVFAGDTLTLHAANIERGILTRKAGNDCNLNLAHASSMDDLELRAFADNLKIINGGALSQLTFIGAQKASFDVAGLSFAPDRIFSVSGLNCDAAVITLAAAAAGKMKSLDVTLDNSFMSVDSAKHAQVAKVHSVGDVANYLVLGNEMANVGGVRTIWVDGNADITLSHQQDFEDLKTVNASQLKGGVSVTVESPDFLTFLGGSGRDMVALRGDTAGKVGQKALFDLGNGWDSMDAFAQTLDGSKMHIDGGAGRDFLIAYGAFGNSAGLLESVEQLDLAAGAGTYHLKDSGVQVLRLISANTDLVVLDKIASGAEVHFLASQTFSTSILVSNAAASKTDELTIRLESTTEHFEDPPLKVGSASAGVSVPGISGLTITSTSSSSVDDYTLYLGSVGSATNPLELTLTGGHATTLASTTKATSYIQTLTIKNPEGVDIKGLGDAIQAFDTGGATIVGGAGDDVLIGGAGRDRISTGGGNNHVHASLGADEIYFKKDSGLDVLHYESPQGSPVSASLDQADIIHNFTVFDTIDLSLLVDTLSFKGNFSSLSAGIAALSTATASAFFSTDASALFVDVNHDGSLDGQHDLSVILTGVASLSSFNLVF